jgi:hypothetical protein
MILLRARLNARSAAFGQAVLLSLGNSEIAFDLEEVRLTALTTPIGEGTFLKVRCNAAAAGFG